MIQARPLRVMNVITELGTGGAESQLHILASEMTRAGHEVCVVSLIGGGIFAHRLRENGVHVVELNTRGLASATGSLFRLIRIMRRFKPDLVQSWLYHADLLTTMARPLAGQIPMLWNIRCAELDPTDHSKTLISIMRLLARLSSLPAAVIANSEAGRRAHELLGYRVRRWAIIPNGIDTERYRPPNVDRRLVRRTLGLPNDVPLIGLVGRYHPMKDHSNFLKAAAIVRRRRENVGFVLVGRGLDADNAELTEMIATFGLQDAVHLLGERRDIAEVNWAVDVATCSSYSEGFPNAIAEAMSCGIPCITTDVGDAAAIVGDAGRVVPARDPESLASAMLDLVALSDEARMQIGRQARERVIANYSVIRLRERYTELYRELIG